MRFSFGLALRFLAGAALSAVLTIGAPQAFAQDRCEQLAGTLQQLERNRDYRNFDRNYDELRQLEAELQDYESDYIRGGCNDAARSGETLSRQCRNLANRIISLRSDQEDLQRSVQTGQAVANQREAILQDAARFSCGSGGGVQVQETQNRRGSFLERLFDGLDGMFDDGNEVREPEPDPDLWYQNRATVRSVCVRLADGYFWPISFATVPEYLNGDAATCEAQCPGQDVELFYYSNPGQEVEQMVSLTGVAYTSLPSAFAYRENYDRALICRPPQNMGIIQIAETATDARAIVSFGELSFPLPLQDPRRNTEATVTIAQFQPSIPLPRPRPVFPGETAPLAAQALPAPQIVAEQRLITLNGRTVRVVGPNTPYAQLGAAGT